jgi:integral membrane sensor domain MASE1
VALQRSTRKALSALAAVGLVAGIIALYAFTAGTPGLLPTSLMVIAFLIVVPWAVNAWYGGS